MNYRIYKNNEDYFLEGNLKGYESLGLLELELKVLNVRNMSYARLVFGKGISYTEIIGLSKRLRISMNRIRIESIEQKVL